MANGLTVIYIFLWPSSLNFCHPTVFCSQKLSHPHLFSYSLKIYLIPTLCLSNPLRSPTPVSPFPAFCTYVPLDHGCGGGVTVWWRVNRNQKGVISLQIQLNELRQRVEMDMFQPLCANLPMKVPQDVAL